MAVADSGKGKGSKKDSNEIFIAGKNTVFDSASDDNVMKAHKKPWKGVVCELLKLLHHRIMMRVLAKDRWAQKRGAQKAPLMEM